MIADIAFNGMGSVGQPHRYSVDDILHGGHTYLAAGIRSLLEASQNLHEVVREVADQASALFLPQVPEDRSGRISSPKDVSHLDEPLRLMQQRPEGIGSEDAIRHKYALWLFSLHERGRRQIRLDASVRSDGDDDPCLRSSDHRRELCTSVAR
ncbi:hypothetical protein AXK56_11620 [Tsukamurella pulmonis]|nr:hypothetical protein AXK56_11620 [Tsukamurella pulmonis]